MKIYRVIYKSIDVDECDNTIKVTTFFNKDLAIKYIEDRIKELKEQMKELDSEDYCVEETENYYERYLDGRSMEESVSIWLEEDNTYDELVLQEEQKMQNEKEKDYEM